MQRRGPLIALVVSLPLLALAWFLYVNIEMRPTKVPAPLGESAQRNPFYGAEILARKLGARAEWRRVLGKMPSTDAVIVLGAWHWSLIESRRVALERWVEAGGRLVVTSMLTDGGPFAEWSGVRGVDPEPEPESEEDADDAETADESGDVEDAEPVPTWRESDQSCAILAAEGAAGGFGADRRYWNICGFRDRLALASASKPLWLLEDEDGAQVVTVARGRGRVTVINLSPFAYRRILVGQNAHLLVAASALREGDHVLFLSANEATPLLTLMWRHGAPTVLLLLALVAVILWRGGRRFGPLMPVPLPARRSLAEQVIGTGRFIRANGGGMTLLNAEKRAVDRLAARRVAGYRQMSADARIDAVAGETGIDYRRVQAAMSWTDGDTRPDLNTALMCLEACRRILAGAARRS